MSTLEGEVCRIYRAEILGYTLEALAGDERGPICFAAVAREVAALRIAEISHPFSDPKSRN